MRFLLPLLLALSLPAFAALEHPLPSSTEVGIPDVVLMQGEVIPTAPAPTATVGQQITAAVLQYVVVPMLPVLGGLLIFALKKLADKLTEEGKTSVAARVAAKLAGAAASAVAEINATLRPQLEAALADGVLTDAEKKQLKDAALALLKTKLPAELLTAASGIFGGFLDTYLGGLVERSLLEQKATAAIGSPRSA